jgi:hypothetical protein
LQPLLKLLVPVLLLLLLLPPPHRRALSPFSSSTLLPLLPLPLSEELLDHLVAHFGAPRRWRSAILRVRVII